MFAVVEKLKRMFWKEKQSFQKNIYLGRGIEPTLVQSLAASGMKLGQKGFVDSARLLTTPRT